MDTIVAIATPPGQGGIAIVRISGPAAQRVLARLFRARGGKPAEAWESHRLMLGEVISAPDDSNRPPENIDEAMAVLMRAPRSYTREDVAEIHCHGGAWTAREVLRLAVAAGARVAEPGEFTRRAFENGRLDLAQAEAVMALIGAQGERSARAALRQMQGGVSRRVQAALAEITRLLSGVEAALDFPDEVDAQETAAGLREGAAALAAELRAACDARGGKLLREGLDVVIAGRPNVGKSTLLNALLGEERAIVTDLPGTTRDTLTERILLGGLVVQLTDTAGLREAGDAVEAIGVSRAQAALRRADLRLIVLDASSPLEDSDRALLADAGAQPCIVALNKGDLPPRITRSDLLALAPKARILEMTARTGEGIPALLDALRAFAALPDAQDAPLTQQRHIEAATRAADALESACAALDAGMPPDLASIDLHRAAECLSSITGADAREEVIDAVFANFCVGK